jgi:hypothetical protein
LVIELVAPSKLRCTVSTTLQDALLPIFLTGFWADEVLPQIFQDHKVGLPIEVSVKWTSPPFPCFAQLKFAPSGPGGGVAVVVMVVVAVVVGEVVVAPFTTIS